MKSKFINVLMFAAGAAIGSAVTWKIVKTHYDRIVQEEIDSIKDAFAGNESDVAQESTDDSENEDGSVHQINWDELEDLNEDEEETEEADFREYARLADNYSSEKGGAESMARNDVHVTDHAREPYVIAPYDFGELDGYRQFELTYYEGDDVLEDEDYNIIADREELIGSKALMTYGEYEEDAVFVRNERLKADFQILKDYRSYKEARSISPDQVGDE